MKRQYHELLARQLSVGLVTELYQLTSAFPPAEVYGFTAQIRRAAVSVPSNIAEGAARATKREFAQFLSIARGSLSEIDTQLDDTQLEIARRLGYVADDRTVQLRMDRVFGLIGGLLKVQREA